MQTIFLNIYLFFKKYPFLFWVSLFLIFSLSLFFAFKIEFEQDIKKMIPHNTEMETMSTILNETKAGEQIIFTLSFLNQKRNDPEHLIKLANDFGDRLQNAAPTYIKSIEFNVGENNEQEFIETAIENLPLFLEEEDYEKLNALTKKENIQDYLKESRKLLLSPAGAFTSDLLARDPIGLMGFAFEKLNVLNYNEEYDLFDGYIFNQELRQLHFFLIPQFPSSETNENHFLFQKTNEVINQFEKSNPEIQISYFGGAAVAAANASQMKSDSFLTLSITSILLLLLIFYVFRNKLAPFFLIIPVIFGGSFGLAITYSIQGSVSIVAIGCGALILGIAIDFSVHFMSHSRRETNMSENVRNLANPLTLGALTTIGAFYALRFTSSPLLQDLGLFASASLLGASLFTLIFLPHLLNKVNIKRDKTIRPNLIDKLASFSPEKNKYLIIIIILVTPILWHYSGKVKFDSDLMHLNYLTPQLERAQEKLNKENTFALSSIYIVAKGKNEQEAAQNMQSVQIPLENLEKQGKIRKALNPLTILPSLEEQKKRIQRWKTYWNQEKVGETEENIAVAGRELGFSTNAFRAFQETLSKDYQPFNEGSILFLKSLMPNAYTEKDGESYIVTTIKTDPKAREDVLSSLSKEKRILATDNRSLTEGLLKTVTQDFNRVLWISGILVFLALLIAYGRIELALISFVPLALTWVWILGIMAIFDLHFNIVNIIIATLIFGLGDDYSIFMMDGLMEKYKTGKNRIKSTRSAVYLSVLTTIIGLGTLIFAQHPALKSIALISVIALICVIFISQVVQPFLFNFLIQSRADKGFMPFTLWSLLKSTFAFFYFFMGCLLLTIAGGFLMGLKPFGKIKSKYTFHLYISKYAKSVLYIFPDLKKKINNHNPQAFQQPAIYIANHTSFLDILAMIMLHPKLILLTNKWVWNSPAFGKIVQMAEYYPVAEGAEDSIQPLQELVNQGYGIVIFPEGTRSEDGYLNRFKKGAAFISEKLSIPIIPVFLHGFAQAMQKGDWLLKKGPLTINIFTPLEELENKTLNYSQKGKILSQWYKKEFYKQEIAFKDISFFKPQLLKSYIYKGPVLEWYCKIKTHLEDYYEPFNQLIPQEGKFYDLGCGYGFMTYMLYWASSGRSFVGIDYDHEKILTAANNYSNNAAKRLGTKNISFVHKDLTSVDLSLCNGIIISDALHYLKPEQQVILLDKCLVALKENGKLIIRDGDASMNQRHKGTQLTETFSTKLLSFNKTNHELHFLSQDFFKDYALKNDLHLEIIDLSKKTSNLIYILNKQI